MTYAEFLKSQGASDADIAVLDTPIAQRAFAAQEQRASAAEAARADADTKLTQYNNWYQKEAVPSYKKMEQDYLVAKGNEARAAAVLLQSQDDGLRAVAESMGYKPDGSPAGGTRPATIDAPRDPDSGKFLPRDEATQMMGRIGESLAELQDLVIEHGQLFPGKRLNVSELRKKAVAAGMNVHDMWEREFHVPEARAAADKAAADAHDAKIREEERTRVTTELTSKFANPDTRPMQPSVNIFTPKKDDALRGKQPWESNSADLSRDRIVRATQKVLEGQTRTN